MLLHCTSAEPMALTFLNILNSENMDRYNEVLAKSRVPESDELVRAEVAKIVEKAHELASPEVYNFLLGSIDLTTLKDGGFSGFGNTFHSARQ